MTIDVNPIVTPAFTIENSYFYGEDIDIPTTSINGINGSWSPVIDNTATTTYLFTPDVGQCSEIIQITIEIIQPINCTQLIHPANQAVDVSTNTYLKWNRISGAIGYYLNIGTYSGGTDILDNLDMNSENIYRDFNFLHGTTYYVTVIAYNENGEAINCNETFFTTRFKIPKFFTPNGDDINDYWNINDRNNLVSYILIFNRFGKVLAKIYPNEAYQWDGRYNGVIIPTDDFWYLIQYKNGKQLKGNFTLKSD